MFKWRPPKWHDWENAFERYVKSKDRILSMSISALTSVSYHPLALFHDGLWTLSGYVIQMSPVWLRALLTSFIPMVLCKLLSHADPKSTRRMQRDHTSKEDRQEDEFSFLHPGFKVSKYPQVGSVLGRKWFCETAERQYGKLRAHFPYRHGIRWILALIAHHPSNHTLCCYSPGHCR